MSFYNMLFGTNPNKDLILALIGLKESDVERYRDCGIDFENKQITVYSRTGGGNREDYPNEALTSSSEYLYDEDDDFDSTYATHYFKFPEGLEEETMCLADVEGKGIPGKLIAHVLKTLNRPETEGDKRLRIYRKQREKVAELQREGWAKTFNGHTVVPLSVGGMTSLLAEAEEWEGELLPYAIAPYRLKVEGSLDERMRIETDWQIDKEFWAKCKDRIGERYPKAVARIQERVDKALSKR